MVKVILMSKSSTFLRFIITYDESTWPRSIGDYIGKVSKNKLFIKAMNFLQ